MNINQATCRSVQHQPYLEPAAVPELRRHSLGQLAGELRLQRPAGQLERRFVGGFSLLTGYTYSKAIDTASRGSADLGTRWYHLRNDRGNSDSMRGTA